MALVDIAKGLHTTSTTLTWAITGPLLVVGISAPLLGRIGDVHGHRRLYLIGMVVALVCAVVTAVAWNAGSLIVARLLSGIGTAALAASSWALLFRVFDGPGERTKVMGWWSLVGAGGPVIGVAVGGPVVQAVGWRWIFVAQVPLILLALMWCLRTLPETDRTPGEPLDVPGALLLAAGVGALLLAINQSGRGWLSPVVLGSLVVAVVAFPCFLVVERRAVAPVLPLEWLARREITMPCLASFAMNFAYMGGFFLTPLFLEAGSALQHRHHRLLPDRPPPGVRGGRPGRRLRGGADGGAGVVGGGGGGAGGLDGGVRGDRPRVVGPVDRRGAGRVRPGHANGVAMPSISAMVAGAVDPQRLGSASAAMQVASQVGVVAGIQVMETVQVARQHSAGLVGSYHSAYVAGAAVASLAGVTSLLIRPVRRRSRVAHQPGLAARPRGGGGDGLIVLHTWLLAS